MKLNLLLATLLATGAVVLASDKVKAEEINILNADTKIAAVVEKPKKEEPKPTAKVEPPIQVHVVVKGDTLSGVAKTYATTWERFYAKNLDLVYPDKINVGDRLVVPRSDEVLAVRALPTAPSAPIASIVPPAPASVQQRAAVAGNTYSRGYCTWHVKNMRPDLPNNLGNADTWYARARAQGIPTGTAPRVGAAGMTKAYMHVVYITAVHGNTVTVSEMNYSGTRGGGFGKVSSRVAPASEFLYIY